MFEVAIIIADSTRMEIKFTRKKAKKLCSKGMYDKIYVLRLLSIAYSCFMISKSQVLMCQKYYSFIFGSKYVIVVENRILNHSKLKSTYRQLVEMYSIKGEVFIIHRIQSSPHHSSLHLVLLLWK